jgi:CDP-Glycerol:Poly(glycerophosphate) glycerophosphotransferase
MWGWPVLNRLSERAESLANHPWMRLLFAGSVVLLPVGFWALVAGNSWAFVAGLSGSAVLDGVLRLAPVGKGRLLQVLRERASQTSTLRIAMVAVAFDVLADSRAAAVVTGAGLVCSLLSRVGVGWLQEYTARVGWDFASGRSITPATRHSFELAGVGQRYSRGLVVSEMLGLVALTAALVGTADAVVVTLAAIAWIPSLELVLVPAWRWLRDPRRVGMPLTADVVPGGRVAVYFPDPLSRAYQLEQWLPVLADLHRDYGVLLVFRDRRVFDLFGDLSDLPRFFARTLDELSEMYAAGNHAVVLYVNNGWRNFQSLAWPRAMHVHINHGESDKTSLVTHQSRAYDRVVVAGTAAIDRMADGLLEMDAITTVIVGRPQLDYVAVEAPASGSRPMVAYAPTWEGENDTNNFSSVDIGGPDIVQALLTVPHVTVLYKPHPRTPGSPQRAMREAHRAICRRLATAAAADPGGGHGLWTGDILPLLARADVLVSDVSSVAVDHLYLRPDAGLVLMDRGRDGGVVKAAEVPIAQAATVLRADQPDDLPATVATLLDPFGNRPHRADIRRQYFGDYEVGESTRRFQSVVAALVALRDRRIAASGAARSVRIESAS